MNLKDYIGEATAYDKKLMLERKDPTSWLKSVSAFANTQGGRLLFGVANDGSLAGLADAQGDAEFISETIKMQMDPVPEIDLSLHEEDGKRFVVVEVKAGEETPYYTFVKGHRDAYIRIGNESVRADAIQLKRLVLKGAHLSWDGLPSRWRLSDFSFEVLRATYFEKRRKSFEDSDFASFDLVGEDGLLSNAGALLADRSPVRHSRVFCTRWKGLTKAHGLMEALADREFSGGLISLFRNTMEFIESNTKMMWRKTGDGRMNYPEYPERAYEEGLVNALIHRDYLELGSEVHVDIYDDRMEITSPGGMPSGHRVQELDARQVTSKRRNPVIADLFQRLDLMERRGSGFKKILDAYTFESEKRGETIVPQFESTRTDFFLILPNLNYGRKINGVESSSEHFDVEVTTEADTNKTGMKTGMDTGDTVNGTVNLPVNLPANLPVNLPANLPEDLTVTAKKIYDLLREDGKYTYDRLATAVGVTRETVRVSIRSLVDAELIRRVGPDKTGHWVVVK